MDVHNGSGFDLFKNANPGGSGSDTELYDEPVGIYLLEGSCVVDGKDDEKSLPRPHVLVPHRAVLLENQYSS